MVPYKFIGPEFLDTSQYAGLRTIQDVYEAMEELVLRVDEHFQKQGAKARAQTYYLKRVAVQTDQEGKPVKVWETEDDFLTDEGHRIMMIDVGAPDAPIKIFEDNAIHGPESWPGIWHQFVEINSFLGQGSCTEAIRENIFQRRCLTLDPFGAETGAKGAVKIDVATFEHFPPVRAWASDQLLASIYDPNAVWGIYGVSPVHDAYKYNLEHAPPFPSLTEYGALGPVMPTLGLSRHETVGTLQSSYVFGNAGVLLIEHLPMSDERREELQEKGRFLGLFNVSRYPRGAWQRIIYALHDAIPGTRKLTRWENMRNYPYFNLGEAMRLNVKQHGQKVFGWEYSRHFADSPYLFWIGHGRCARTTQDMALGLESFGDYICNRYRVPAITEETFAQGSGHPAGGISMRVAQKAYLTEGAYLYLLERMGAISLSLSDLSIRVIGATDSLRGKFNSFLARLMARA